MLSTEKRTYVCKNIEIPCLLTGFFWQYPLIIYLALDSEKQEVNDESENNICRRRKGTKRLLIMTSLVVLGIGILFVVTLINVEPGSSGKY